MDNLASNLYICSNIVIYVKGSLCGNPSGLRDKERRIIQNTLYKQNCAVHMLLRTHLNPFSVSMNREILFLNVSVVFFIHISLFNAWFMDFSHVHSQAIIPFSAFRYFAIRLKFKGIQPSLRCWKNWFAILKLLTIPYQAVIVRKLGQNFRPSSLKMARLFGIFVILPSSVVFKTNQQIALITVQSAQIFFLSSYPGDFRYVECFESKFLWEFVNTQITDSQLRQTSKKNKPVMQKIVFSFHLEMQKIIRFNCMEKLDFIHLLSKPRCNRDKLTFLTSQESIFISQFVNFDKKIIDVNIVNSHIWIHDNARYVNRTMMSKL